MKKIIKRKLHISTYSRDFIDYINHEFYSHDKHNAFFEFTMEQLPTDNVVALFYFQKTKRYAEIKGTVEDNKVTIEFDTSLITTNETVCGYIYFEKVEQSADVCRFCFNVKVSEIDKLKNAPVVEKETRRLIPMSEIVTKTELQELFKTIEKNGGTYNDTEIRRSITSIEERVQTLETKPDNNTVYDDSELSRRVSALETKEDKDTVYNDEEIKRRLSNLEGKTDNFISGVSVNKEGNNVTLTYNYVDGQTKNVSFTDSDTLNIAYDDSALKTRLNDLENRPQIDVSEFAKKSEVPTAESVMDLTQKFGEHDNKIQILEAKVGYEVHGNGMPNGVVEAPIGTTYIDTAKTNGALKWIKTTDGGNQGWKVVEGDTGWVLCWQEDKGNYKNRMYFRRINDVVHVQFKPKIDTSSISPTANLILEIGGVESEDNLSIDGFQPNDDIVQTIHRTSDNIYSSTANTENSEGAQGTGAVIIQYQYAPYNRNRSGLQLQIVTSQLGVEENHVNPFSYLTEDEWPTTLPTL